MNFRIVAYIISGLLLVCETSICGQPEGDTSKDNNRNSLTNGVQITPAVAVKEAIALGNLDEAEHILQNIDGNEYARLTFMGIIALKRQHSQKALVYFEKAASLDANRPELHLLVAQAFFQTGDLQNTLTALKKGESSGSSLPSYYLFRGGVALQLSLYEEAWATFNMGYQLFPKEPVFLKELSVVMARAGLFATAAEYGDAYMKEAPHDVEGIVVIAHALLQNHQSVTAARILEGAVNTHPDNLELLASLAASYGQADKPLSAARILSRAAILNNSYAFDAAQYFIAAGKWREAMNMNLLVEKHPEKMSQRLRIFFQQGNFSRVTMMGAEMDKDEKRTDEDLYCLVYAWAQLGNVEFAASIAKQIKEKKKHNLAMEILKTISQNQ